MRERKQEEAHLHLCWRGMAFYKILRLIRWFRRYTDDRTIMDKPEGNHVLRVNYKQTIIDRPNFQLTLITHLQY